MVVYADAANPEILRWARQRAHMSMEEAAAKVSKSPELIGEWESAEGRSPAWGQLETLAGLYRLPLAVFFFPEPPEEALPKPDFRTLPDTDMALLSADVMFAVRESMAMQESLRELTGNRNPADEMITAKVRPRSGEGIPAFCERIRRFLGVSIETQTGWRDHDRAFREWRTVLQQHGIFVFKRPFLDDAVSGYCLPDDTFPVIVVSTKTPPTRQTFTLFHEMAHLLLGVSGATPRGEEYVNRLPAPVRNIEVRCNRIAAELLMPASEFDRTLTRFGADLDAATRELSRHFSVSREAVYRRLLDKGLVTRDDYEERAKQWAREAERKQQEKRGKGGPGYYRKTVSQLGEAYLGVAFQAYHERRCTLPELAGHLRMKASNVQNLENRLAAGKV